MLMDALNEAARSITKQFNETLAVAMDAALESGKSQHGEFRIAIDGLSYGGWRWSILMPAMVVTYEAIPL